MRDHFLSRAKKSMNSNDWKLYRMARNQVVKMIGKAKRDYFKKSVADNSGTF